MFGFGRARKENETAASIVEVVYWNAAEVGITPPMELPDQYISNKAFIAALFSFVDSTCAKVDLNTPPVFGKVLATLFGMRAGSILDGLAQTLQSDQGYEAGTAVDGYLRNLAGRSASKEERRANMLFLTQYM